MVLSTLLLLLLFDSAISSIRDNRYETYINEEIVLPEDEKLNVKIAKCCEATEVLLDSSCTFLKHTNETNPWQPEFEAEDNYEGSKSVPTPKYSLRIGWPRCKSNDKQWDVYYYDNGADKLVILPSGTLRHYIYEKINEVEINRYSIMEKFYEFLDSPVEHVQNSF